MLWLQVLVNLLGLMVIGLIIGWFWLWKSKTIVVAKQVVEIKVADGVYTPDAIQLVRDRPVTLRFIREDETPCAGTVLIPDLKESAELVVGQPVDITVTPEAVGEFEFTCQMGMYRGWLIVRLKTDKQV